MQTVPTPIITKPLRWKFVKTCDVINKVTRRKSNKTVNELKPNGTKTSNSTEFAETFDNFFAEIVPRMSKEEVDVDTCFEEFDSQTINRFSFQHVTQSQVLSHSIKRLPLQEEVGKAVRRYDFKSSCSKTFLIADVSV